MISSFFSIHYINTHYHQSYRMEQYPLHPTDYSCGSSAPASLPCLHPTEDYDIYHPPLSKELGNSLHQNYQTSRNHPLRESYCPNYFSVLTHIYLHQHPDSVQYLQRFLVRLNPFHLCKMPFGLHK